MHFTIVSLIFNICRHSITKFGEIIASFSFISPTHYNVSSFRVHAIQNHLVEVELDIYSLGSSSANVFIPLFTTKDVTG